MFHAENILRRADGLPLSKPILHSSLYTFLLTVIVKYKNSKTKIYLPVNILFANYSPFPITRTHALL